MRARVTFNGEQTIQSVWMNVCRMIDHASRSAARLRCPRVESVTRGRTVRRRECQRMLMSDRTDAIDEFSMANKWLPVSPVKTCSEKNHHGVFRSLRASVGAMFALGDAYIVVSSDSLLKWMIFHSASAIDGAQLSHSVVVNRTS